MRKNSSTKKTHLNDIHYLIHGMLIHVRSSPLKNLTRPQPRRPLCNAISVCSAPAPHTGASKPEKTHFSLHIGYRPMKELRLYVQARVCFIPSRPGAHHQHHHSARAPVCVCAAISVLHTVAGCCKWTGPTVKMPCGTPRANNTTQKNALSTRM